MAVYINRKLMNIQRPKKFRLNFNSRPLFWQYNFIVLLAFSFSSYASGVTYMGQALIILPNGLVELNGVVDSVDHLLVELGPKDNHITLIACPNSSFKNVMHIKSKLIDIGYKKIGFAPIGRLEAGICVSSLARKKSP